MNLGHTSLFLLALGFLLAGGTPLKGPSNSVSLPLHRSLSLYESEDAQGSLPLMANGIESLVYTVDVQVGSQRFNLTLDTSQLNSVLFAKDFVASNQSCSTGDAQRNHFNPSMSKTFEVTGGFVPGHWLNYYPYVGLECQQSLGSIMHLDGVFGRDTYQFGALSVPHVPFILSNNTYPSPLNPRWASDGVFPLDMDYATALMKILDASGGNYEVSLFLNNARPSDSQPVPGGRITFGGKNTQDCSDKWVTLRTDLTYWSLPLNSVTVGTWSMNADRAKLSTSSPFLQAPPWFFRPLVVSALGGTFNEDLDLYTVDCGKVDTLPSMSINMGSGFSLTYTIKPQDYVAKINGKNGVECALLIVLCEDDEWVVGTQFLPKRCVHLDFGKGQVGFADPKN